MLTHRNPFAGTRFASGASFNTVGVQQSVDVVASPSLSGRDLQSMPSLPGPSGVQSMPSLPGPSGVQSLSSLSSSGGLQSLSSMPSSGGEHIRPCMPTTGGLQSKPRLSSSSGEHIRQSPCLPGSSVVQSRATVAPFRFQPPVISSRGKKILQLSLSRSNLETPRKELPETLKTNETHFYEDLNCEEEELPMPDGNIVAVTKTTVVVDDENEVNIFHGYHSY